MFLQEVSGMLEDRKELEYHLANDEFTYVDRSPGRFTESDFTAMVGDATRQLALLQAERLLVGPEGHRRSYCGGLHGSIEHCQSWRDPLHFSINSP